MKFTNEYIEMVSKAEEIQGLCQHKEGDYFYGLDGLEWKIKKMNYWIIPDKHTVGSETFYDLVTWSKQFPWLPTLENLLGMLNKTGHHIHIYYSDNKGICKVSISSFGYIFDGGIDKVLELVLQLIMKLLYNKSWNGKEWEEIK